MRELEIIFEDRDILVCRKPAGVATQTKRLGQQDMESLLKNYRVKNGEPPYIGIVHRLDQPVEGLMVFAKNQQAAAHLSKQVQDREIGKYYYAISAKAPMSNDGVLEDYLLTDKKTNYTRVVDDNIKEAKKAKLEYKVIGSEENKILFDIKLHTGRQHQIRVQMAHAGCPLIGDGKYGSEKGVHGLALCSYRLIFDHPASGLLCDYKIEPSLDIFKDFNYILRYHR